MPRSGFRLARAAQALAIRGHATVNRPQQNRRAGNLREREQRPRPPDAPRDLHQSIRAAEDFFVVRQQQFHFVQRITRLQAELRLHPWRLQRRALKAVTMKQRRETNDGGAAQRAIAVIKNPAANGLVALRFQGRCCRRGHGFIFRCRGVFESVCQTWRISRTRSPASGIFVNTSRW